jgi:glycosyltransferase involved in cell wall biosynthesis
MGGAERLKLLVVRGSFDSLGGAERELLTVLREWSKRWDITLATLQFPPSAQKLAEGLDIEIISPENEYVAPSGAISEILGKESKAARKAWAGISGLRQAIASADVAHLSVCRGTLEILPLLPEGLGIHYHCLEPPRWLHEDVLHRNLDGTLKRPAWITNFLFRKQKKTDIALVKSLLKRKGAAISGNSHWIQSQLSKYYSITHDPSLENGQPAPRKDGLCAGASVLMHVVDISDWPSEAFDEDVETPEVNGKYVVTVGRISHVKGTWETLHSLAGTGLSLVQVGGGSDADKALLNDVAKRLGVGLFCMPRLEQNQLRKLVRGAIAMVSHAHGEPFGLTPIEAMAIGIPALFVDEGGFHYTMKDVDSGMLLARDGDWKAAYQACQNEDNRNKWALAGRPHVEGKFTLEVQADGLEKLLEDCRLWSKT